MKRVALMFLWILCLAPAWAAAAAENSASVIVFSRGIGGTTCGNGFVIGDGTLLITARHVVYPERPGGLHQGDAFVTIFSPYLGDACEAEIVAQDRALDVAILRLTWIGHPALQLADEADVVAAEKVTLKGFAAALGALTAGKPHLLERSTAHESAGLDVNAVVVRAGVSKSVVTASAPAGGGWGGAAMLLNETSTVVVGCYARTQANGTAGVGAAAGEIRRLIEQSAAARALNGRAPLLPPRADAAAATMDYLRAVAASSAGDAPAASASLECFRQLRPNSAIGYRESAGQAWAQNNPDRAQALYAKALEIEPSLVSARVLYGQLLHQRFMPARALEHLRYVWEHGRCNRTAAVIPMCNLLREQGREKDCADLLAAAVQQNPTDGYLWNYLGQSRGALGEHASAAAAFARSADLMPENESVRLKAADEHVAAGDRAKAEAQYRAAIDQHPRSASAYYYLARFLARETDRREEALRASRVALDLADRPGAPPRATIQSLISAISSGRASPASDFKL